jgi:ribonuclease-3
VKIRFTFFRKGPDKALHHYLKKNFSITPGDISLYKTAFQHKSMFREQQDVSLYNERLEFLGDSILDAVVAEYLYLKFPEEKEGSLTKLKAKLVNREYLNKIGDKFNIGEQLRYQSFGDNTPKSIIGNALEAIIGAIYLDKGFRFTRKFIIEQIVQKQVSLEELMREESDFKSKIIIWGQREKKNLIFRVDKEEKEGADKIYYIALVVDGESICVEKARNKKEAEQLAAKSACVILSI